LSLLAGVTSNPNETPIFNNGIAFHYEDFRL